MSSERIFLIGNEMCLWFYFSYVEPPVAETLELAKLMHLDPSYSPSRNRQWHLFTVTEQERRKTQKRVYLRGVVRQVSSHQILLPTN